VAAAVAVALGLQSGFGFSTQKFVATLGSC
jgi:hypothetical protein